EQRRNAIRQAFYVDQLLLSTGPAMTATEVLQRNEEKMRLLGPVLGRLQAELLQPLIDRVFNLLLRARALPPAPEELQGQNIDIEYVSPLAKAQKLTDLQSVMRGMELMLQGSQFAPVTDYLDAAGRGRYIAETTGIPATVLRSDEQVADLRRQAAEAQAQQAQMQQAMQMAEAGGQIAPLVKAVR
ncbi:MAG: portal protein, partial [Pseudomonadales bacterium]